MFRSPAQLGNLILSQGRTTGLFAGLSRGTAASSPARATASFANTLANIMGSRQDRPRVVAATRQDLPRSRSLPDIMAAHLAQRYQPASSSSAAKSLIRPAVASTDNRRSGNVRQDVQSLMQQGARNARSGRIYDSKEFDPIIAEASRQYQVPEKLVRAVIKAESNFNPKARSHAGAMGLMQLMPGTAADLGVRNAYDPRENIMGGTRYLKDLLDRYNGNIPMALAAYNWGMGNLERGGALPAETRNYIQQVSKFFHSTAT